VADDQEKSAVELLNEVKLNEVKKENILLLALVARLAKVNAAWQSSRFVQEGIDCVAIDTPEGPLAWDLPGWARHLFEHRYYKNPPRKTLVRQSSETRCALIESLVKNIDRMLEQSEKVRQ
jgi:hypothetical protein